MSARITVLIVSLAYWIAGNVVAVASVLVMSAKCIVASARFLVAIV